MILHESKPYYIAVCKYGYGVDKIPALAIRLAQTEVPASAKASQLLLYADTEFIEPKGFEAGVPVWPDGSKPRLVGLTNTHQGFRQSFK